MRAIIGSKIMHKSRQFIKNVVKNALTFGIYIAGYHLLMLPYLAKHLDVAVNARLLTYIMISSILTISVGNQLGIFYQLVMGRSPDKQTHGDLRWLYRQSSVLLAVLTLVILLIVRFTVLEAFLLTGITLLTNARLFYLAYLRMYDEYKAMAIGNGLYVVGVVLAIIWFQWMPTVYWLPLLLAEICSVVYLHFFAAKPFRSIPAARGTKFTDHVKAYVNLVTSALLNNIPNYTDKLLILALLGELSMSAYYAGTTFSKMLFLLANPINGVLLVWLAKRSDDDEHSVVRRQLRANFLIALVVFAVSLPVIYIMTKIFYAQFFEVIRIILFPLALSAGFAIAASFLRVLFMRYADIRYLKYINVARIILFIALASLGSKLSGVRGFAYGVSITNFLYWLLFMAALFYRTSERRNIKNPR
ncbi:MAG: lipopolysaccharide biosynthesis protein [Saccharofermentanales bacterium]